MKYGWRCNKCGDFTHNINSINVASFKKAHKENGCELVKTNHGTLTRPSLLDQSNSKHMSF